MHKVYEDLLQVFIDPIGFTFFKLIFVLGYSGFLEYFTQGGIDVPRPHFYALVDPPFDVVFYRVPVPASAVCAWVVEGLGWCGGGGGGGVDGFWCSRARLPE